MPTTDSSFRSKGIKAYDQKPALFAGFIVFIYLLILIVPGLFSSHSFGKGKGLNDASEIIKQLPFEIFLVTSIALVISFFSQWRHIGARSSISERRKYIWIAMCFPGLVLFAAISQAESADLTDTLFNNFPVQQLALLALMTLLIGMFEELLFRGVLQSGIHQTFGEIKAVVLAALVFGLAHYANWVHGKPFVETSYQVLSAFSSGLLLGALRLMTASIWPPILVHGSWDFSVLLLGKVVALMPESHTGASLVTTASLAIALIAKPIFGTFLLMQYWQANRQIRR